jgi:hypothetical protein
VKPRPPLGLIVFAATLIAGAIAAYVIAQHGLTLAHYDARGHLIVARRLTDSLTPGWLQLGALWLPVPHLLNAIPVMWDWNYRTGFSAVAINLVAMSAGLAALAAFVARRTGSTVAAVTVVAVVQLNPAVLYLSATPMTEPLLFAFCWLALNAADRRLDAPESYVPLSHPGVFMALAVLTRYEAWPVAAALTTLTALSRPNDRVRTFVRLALWPAAAAAAFLLFGRLTLGRFLSDASGFFTPDNPAAGHPFVAATQIVGGFIALAGWPVEAVALIGLFVLAESASRTRSLRPLLPVALSAAAALPFSAFLDGHPFRVRYMVVLVAAAGALIGAAIGALPRQWRAAGAALLLGITLWLRPPLALDSPMVQESRRESHTQSGRASVTSYLAAHYDERPILASMNSLGHYMQELSAIGLPLRDFINAGNGDIWTAAIAHPERHAGWILIEEQAEGGDELATLAKQRPEFLSGFESVAAGGGARLYRHR